jgi:flagellar hook-associated protein 3 FlgL
MIRTPRTGTSDLFLHRVDLASARVRRAEEQAVTGMKVNRASDAPTVMREVHAVSAGSADQAVYKDNAGSAGMLHSTMDSSLERAQDIVVRLRELAVQMSSDAVDADGRAAAAVEVRSLQASMLDTANAQVGGRYVFAGAVYDAPAFDSAFAYQGDANEPETRVGQDRWVRTGLDGQQVFQGSTDIFATIENLAVALETNSVAATRASLPDLEAGTRQLSQWRSVVGSEQATAEDAAVVAESLDLLFSDRLSALVQADPVAAYTELGEAQNAYTTTLQVIASTRTDNLFDMLR